MENCLKDDIVLVEAPKFARLLKESGILIRFLDLAGNRIVLDAVRTLRLIADIVFCVFCFFVFQSIRTN